MRGRSWDYYNSITGLDVLIGQNYCLFYKLISLPYRLLVMIGSKLHLSGLPLVEELTTRSLLTTLFALTIAVIVGYVVITEAYRAKIRIPNIPGPIGYPVGYSVCR